MSETIGDRVLDLAEDYRRAGERQNWGAIADMWKSLDAEATKVDACEAIARAALARHKAAERSHRWRTLYRLSARNKRPDRPGRHIRIGAKLIEAMNVADNYYDSERAACQRWGDKL